LLGDDENEKKKVHTPSEKKYGTEIIDTSVHFCCFQTHFLAFISLIVIETVSPLNCITNWPVIIITWIVYNIISSMDWEGNENVKSIFRFLLDYAERLSEFNYVTCSIRTTILGEETPNATIRAFPSIGRVLLYTQPLLLVFSSFLAGSPRKSDTGVVVYHPSNTFSLSISRY
jgi:hypothetical protein